MLGVPLIFAQPLMKKLWNILVQHNVQIFPCSESIFRDRTMVKSTQNSEYHSLQHSSSSGLSRKVARWAANRLKACAPLLTRFFLGFNWRRSCFYSVSPEQNCQWDISQRRQKEKKAGNNQLLLCNAQPNCDLQLSVTPRPRRGSSRAVALCLHGCRLPDGTDFLLASFHSPS